MQERPEKLKATKRAAVDIQMGGFPTIRHGSING
jgi:hypothetical protein